MSAAEGRRRGRRALPLTLALLVAAAPAVGAQDVPPVPSTGAVTEGPTPLRHHDGRRTVARLPANYLRGLVGVFHGDNVYALSVGGMATGAAATLDQVVRIDVGSPLGWGDSFQTAGGPIYSTILVGGLFVAGRLAHGDRFRAMTYDVLDAAAVSFTYTGILKNAVGRERPNGQDHQSFPSGHTSNAFALAAVVQGHYGWRLGAPTFALAGAMGLSRINQDKHWLSDVVAGATIGYVCGRTVVRVNRRPLARAAEPFWSVGPVLARRARGVQVSVLF